MNQVKLSTASPGMNIEYFVEKLAEETMETIYEVGYTQGAQTDQDDLLLLSEVFDVMQVCYTFLVSNYTQEEIDTANIKHLEKLRSRYGKD